MEESFNFTAYVKLHINEVKWREAGEEELALRIKVLQELKDRLNI
ncbi:MAG: hypothetical protein K0R57_6292 [Paenibacillaceae bacterium]|nr:hypothetical protein [Paenibacillaceae bacterium]